jgi:imidazolonepropionase-like amidohydrolase
VRLFLRLAFMMLVFEAGAALIGAAAALPQLVLTHVSVIDSTANAVRPDQSVVIVNGHIAAIGPSARIKLPKDARIVDGQGKFLVPGLWDMHVHIAGLNADPAWSKQVLLPLLLANGVTGVRDMGGDLDTLLAWKREIEAGTLVGPHIVACGPFLVGSGSKTAEQYPIANVEEARAAVRDLKRRGAEFIKIISVPSKEVFFAVADEAKKQNIPFAGHLPFQVSAQEASNAGMRSIEHLLYSAFSLSFSSKEDDLRVRLIAAEDEGDSVAWEQIAHESDATYDKEKAAQLFQTLKRNGTWVTPTLASLDITAHPEDWSADDPQLAFAPPSLAKQAANDWRLTGELHHAGIPLLVGSDSLDAFVIPGESLHRELGELVRAGLTPAEALSAATRGAATFLGREHDLGTVETGKIADLVLLDGSPLENIANTQRVNAVVRAGVYLDRGELDRLLTQAKAAAAGAASTK